MQKILSPNLIGGKTIYTNNTIKHTKETLWKTIIHSPFLQPTRSECSPAALTLKPLRL
jgi:hypothetical protein